MSSRSARLPDPLVDEVRSRRQALVRRYGGLKGWVKHLQELEQRGGRKSRPRERVGSK